MPPILNQKSILYQSPKDVSMFSFPRPFHAFMPSYSCISMKIKIKLLVHYTSSTVETLPCLGMEETSPEAELLKDTQSQQGIKQVSLLTGWKLNGQEFCFWVGRGEGKKEKRYVACASPQNLSQVLNKFQGSNGNANTTIKEAESCCNYK